MALPSAVVEARGGGDADAAVVGAHVEGDPVGDELVELIRALVRARPARVVRRCSADRLDLLVGRVLCIQYNVGNLVEGSQWSEPL